MNEPPPLFACLWLEADADGCRLVIGSFQPRRADAIRLAEERERERRPGLPPCPKLTLLLSAADEPRSRMFNWLTRHGVHPEQAGKVIRLFAQELRRIARTKRDST